jgi:hypothetical protein
MIKIEMSVVLNEKLSVEYLNDYIGFSYKVKEKIDYVKLNEKIEEFLRNNIECVFELLNDNSVLDDCFEEDESKNG